MRLDKRSLFRMVGGSALWIVLGFVAKPSLAATTPDGCVIPEWRQARYDKLVDTMWNVSEQVQPLSKVGATDRSCLSDFQNMGVDLSAEIPTSIGGLLSMLKDSLMDGACEIAERWVQDAVSDMNNNLRQSVGGNIANTSVSRSGLSIRSNATSSVQNTISSSTGIRTNVPKTRKTESTSVDELLKRM